MKIISFKEEYNYQDIPNKNKCGNCINHTKKINPAKGMAHQNVYCNLGQFYTPEDASCNAWMDKLPEGSE